MIFQASSFRKLFWIYGLVLLIPCKTAVEPQSTGVTSCYILHFWLSICLDLSISQWLCSGCIYLYVYCIYMYVYTHTVHHYVPISQSVLPLWGLWMAFCPSSNRSPLLLVGCWLPIFCLGLSFCPGNPSRDCYIYIYNIAGLLKKSPVISIWFFWFCLSVSAWSQGDRQFCHLCLAWWRA